MPYYLGIDGGGSKTSCAVGDDSTVLAVASAGPSNVVRVGEAQARESLLQCVRQACSAAGITPAQVARTCVGASGAARPQVAAAVRKALAEILPTPIDVVGDTETSVEAAFDTGPGVIVIAGTGSVAYGRDPNGNTARAGGWGFAVSDEGSAHWIGRAAISAALRARDCGDTSHNALLADHDLLPALMKVWGIGNFDEFVRAANSTPAPDFSTLFPVVTSAAADNPLAQQVLVRAGIELAQLAHVVIARLFPSPSPAHAASNALVPVAMVGGVFRHAPIVCQVFYNELYRLDPRADINPQIIDPVNGALRLARKACGADTPVRRS